MNYQAYIKSAAWREKREAEFKRCGFCCEFCGAGDVKLNCHHLTYDRLGQELPEDLIVLCEFCHADLHEHERLAERMRTFAARRTQPVAEYDETPRGTVSEDAHEEWVA